MASRVKAYGVLALIVLAAAGLYLYQTKPAWLTSLLPGSVQAKAPGANDPKGKKPEKEATPVELAVAEKSDISSYLQGTANLRALREVAIATEADGVVAKVLTEEGDYVKEGQVLCVLADEQTRIKLSLAEEKLAQARFQMDKTRIKQEKALAQMGHSKIELERYQRARKEGLVSDKEVATYQYKLEELVHDEKVAGSEWKEFQHHVSELEADIRQSKLDLSRTQIKAPFAGFVTNRTVNVGQRVRASDALYNLGSFSPLYADVHLSERDVLFVKPTQPVTVRLGSDESSSLVGRVERISPIVDQASGTVKVTVALNPKAGFRPGAFVRVEIRTDTKSGAVVIPKRAIIEEDGRSFVYIAGADSAKRTEVKLGYQREGMVEIRTGVTLGQKVVVAGQGALKEGNRIKAVTVPSQTRAASLLIKLLPESQSTFVVRALACCGLQPASTAA